MTPAQTLWAQVKANRARIEDCKRHRFPGGAGIRLGQKHVCLECGGEMQLTEVGPYIRGYEAAGGNADDIWPSYRTEYK